MRSPPVPSHDPTRNDLEELQLAVADGEVSLNLTTVTEAESSLVESDSDNPVMEGDSGRMMGPRFPSHVRMKMICDKKGCGWHLAESCGIEEEPQAATETQEGCR